MLRQNSGGRRYLCDQLRQSIKFRDVDDHGVIAGSALGGVDRPDRRFVKGIGGKPVHRLGRNGDQSAVPQDIAGTQDTLGVPVRVVYSDQFCLYHGLGYSLFCSFSACSCAKSGSMSRSRSPFITASKR